MLTYVNVMFFCYFFFLGGGGVVFFFFFIQQECIKSIKSAGKYIIILLKVSSIIYI